MFSKQYTQIVKLLITYIYKIQYPIDYQKEKTKTIWFQNPQVVLSELNFAILLKSFVVILIPNIYRYSYICLTFKCLDWDLMIEGLEKRIGCTKLLNSAFHCKQILFSLLSRDIFFLKANGVIYQLIHTIVFKILFMYVPVHLRVLLLVRV